MEAARTSPTTQAEDALRRGITATNIRKVFHDEGAQLTLGGHRRSVESVEFSPDGGLLVTASEDGTARL